MLKAEEINVNNPKRKVNGVKQKESKDTEETAKMKALEETLNNREYEKNSGEPETWKALMDNIFIQACFDYKQALEKKKEAENVIANAEIMIKDCESFFVSDWCKEITCDRRLDNVANLIKQKVRATDETGWMMKKKLDVTSKKCIEGYPPEYRNAIEKYKETFNPEKMFKQGLLYNFLYSEQLMDFFLKAFFEDNMPEELYTALKNANIEVFSKWREFNDLHHSVYGFQNWMETGKWSKPKDRRLKKGEEE